MTQSARDDVYRVRYRVRRVGKWPGRSTLHLIIPDGDDPFTEVRRLTAALAPGSFLAVTDSADGAAMWADVARKPA